MAIPNICIEYGIVHYWMNKCTDPQDKLDFEYVQLQKKIKYIELNINLNKLTITSPSHHCQISFYSNSCKQLCVPMLRLQHVQNSLFQIFVRFQVHQG